MPQIDLGSVVGPQGPTGPQGATGATGAQGAAGPNQVSSNTSCALSGVLYGNNAKVTTIEVDSVATSGSSHLATSGSVVSALSCIANPNLLDNWYFVGGGNQQSGAFPINQRENSAYTGAVQMIDRWKGETNANSITLASEYATFASTGTGRISQTFENPLPYGKYTLSVLYKSATAASAIYFRARDNDGNNLGAAIVINTTADASLHLGFVTITGSPKSVYFQFVSTAGTVDVVAVKLERGAVQTLAQEIGGGLEITEIPNFQQELAKCQRYLLVVKSIGTYGQFSLGQAGSTTAITFPIKTPVTMRSPAALITVGTIALLSGGSSSRIDPSSFPANINTMHTNEALVIPNVSGLTTGTMYRLVSFQDPNAYITIDASI